MQFETLKELCIIWHQNCSGGNELKLKLNAMNVGL
jgi:hypothetical protein